MAHERHDEGFKAEVLDYAKANKEESAASIGRFFGLPGRTVRNWMSAAGISRPKKDGTPRKKPGNGGNGGRGGNHTPPERASRARPAAITKRGGRRPRARACAEDISSGDRDEALSIVRGSRSIAKRYLDHVEELFDRWGEEMERIEGIEDPRERMEAIENNPIPKVDARETQALLNLQKTAAEVLDTHPGLMELRQEGGDKSTDKAERRRRVRAALGFGSEE